MKWWTWAVGVASAGALAACSSDPISDGSGGAGGDSTTGAGQQAASSSAATTSSSSAASTVSSSGSGGSMCDAIGICQDPANPMAMTCSSCAQQGDCADEVAACQADPACVQLNMCFMQCMPGDQMCINNCAMMNMAGYMVYNQINLCVVCGNCRMSCAQFVMQLGCP